MMRICALQHDLSLRLTHRYQLAHSVIVRRESAMIMTMMMTGIHVPMACSAASDWRAASAPTSHDARAKFEPRGPVPGACPNLNTE